MVRTALTSVFGSWTSAVGLAAGSALIAMVAAAGVTVLASDDVAAASDVYGRKTVVHRAGGKHAVRAAAAAFPDTCFVTYIPTIARLANEAAESVQPILSTIPVRPLHEADEVPENFI